MELGGAPLRFSSASGPSSSFANLNSFHVPNPIFTSRFGLDLYLFTSRRLNPTRPHHPPTMSAPSSLLAATDDRKARLAKLKSLKRKQPDDETAPPDTHRSPSPTKAPHLSGRNYDPEARGPRLGFESAPVGDAPTLEELAADAEAEVREKAKQEEVVDQGVDLFKLQPKRPNWDLKRDLEAKLAVLDVRTDNAIARLVRERVGGQSGGGKEGGEGMEGVAMVEGLRVREREEAEEERKEREELGE